MVDSCGRKGKRYKPCRKHPIQIPKPYATSRKRKSSESRARKMTWNSRNWPFTKRRTRLDLPAPMSPRSTWEIHQIDREPNKSAITETHRHLSEKRKNTRSDRRVEIERRRNLTHQLRIYVVVAHGSHGRPAAETMRSQRSQAKGSSVPPGAKAGRRRRRGEAGKTSESAKAEGRWSPRRSCQRIKSRWFCGSIWTPVVLVPHEKTPFRRLWSSRTPSPRSHRPISSDPGLWMSHVERRERHPGQGSWSFPSLRHSRAFVPLFN